MKAFTDIEQSKKLAEILPIESADMVYIATANDDIGDILYTAEYKSEIIIKEDDTDYINCWSLAALLSVIPEVVPENYYVPNLQKVIGKYSISYADDELLCLADNPVDACVNMIIKLHELKML